MLREARIVMPTFHTEASSDAHMRLRKMLCDAFGGFTSFVGHGGWRDPSGNVVYDNVVIYDVAMDGSRLDRNGSYDTLIGIAVDAGRALDQQEVYVRYCNGNVDLIKVLSDEERNEKAERLLHKVAAREVKPVADRRETPEPDDEAGALRLLKAIFGEDNVATIIDEDRLAKPQPGQLWTTRGGGKAFVGRRATLMDGGWYVTLVEDQSRYRAGFEYVVDLQGRLAGLGVDSTLDLVTLTA